MSIIDEKTVANLSDLSKIEFSDSESATLQQELTKVLGFISQLEEVNVDGVQPMTSVVEGMATPEREDEVTVEDRREELLASAPEQEMGFYVVPRTVE